ncbi:MAG: hypothetical protein AB1918_06445 [Pseudomonadota bacterium]
MFGWLRALFLDEKARKAVDAKARAKAAAARKPATAPPPPAPKMTPKRQQLIKDAMAVHRAKRKILDDLSDEDRARLVAMAITALMNEGREPPPDEIKKKK